MQLLDALSACGGESPNNTQPSTPAVSTPVVSTPAVSTPVVSTPAVSTPVASSAPAVSNSSSSPASPSPKVNAKSDLVVAINAGGAGSAQLNGITFDADRFYTGGEAGSTADPITGSDQDDLFQSERWGKSSYKIPVSNAVYSIELHFAEIYQNAANKRAFSVNIEGTEEMSNVDLFSLIGHDTAYTYSVEMVNVKDGMLNIDLVPGDASNPTISGIAIYSMEGKLDETAVVVSSSSADSVSSAPSKEGQAPSSGCGKAANQAAGKWVSKPKLNIKGKNRNWDIRLPNNYDSSRAYPVVVMFHGCGGISNNTKFEAGPAAKEGILMRGQATGKCWGDAGPGSANLEFFDKMIDGVSKQACVDKNKIFASGYSSGSFVLSWLACERADVLRGLVSTAGENKVPNGHKCKGPVARIYAHDLKDKYNKWNGYKPARDRLLKLNGCQNSTIDVSPSPCKLYQGCGDNPVMECITSGFGWGPGHSSWGAAGDGSKTGQGPAAFWKFFMNL